MMDKNIVFYSDQKCLDQTLLAIDSFTRFCVNSELNTFTFYYFCIGFKPNLNRKEIVEIQIDPIENIPTFWFYKPVIIKKALEFLDHFVFLDSDIIASHNFNYNKLLSSVHKYPKASIIHNWNYPYYWWFDDKGEKHTMSYKKLMDYIGVEKETQHFVCTPLMAVNKSCRDFVNEWCDICMNKDLWFLDHKEPIVQIGDFVITKFLELFPAGDETLYNVLLWRDKVTDYFFKGAIINTDLKVTILALENSQSIINENLEPDNDGAFCVDSKLIQIYHRIKDIDLKRQIIYNLIN